MSDSFILVIPAEPDAECPPTADRMRDALARMVGSDEVRVKDYGKIQFIDAGKLARSITCPTCGQFIGPAHWHEWMENAWQGTGGFHLHTEKTPCCGNAITLNDLVYDAPQGFARWFVSARQGSRDRLSEAEVRHLEDIAGLRLTAIAQMY